MYRTHQLSVRLLGGVALERDGRPCELAYEKGRALLAYLATEPGRWHPRESLAAMFWPDLAREAALTNLRQVLHDLRKVLNADSSAPPLLQANRAAVCLNLVAGLKIDLTEFSAPAPACPTIPCLAHCTPCLARMEDQAKCYRGEFLAGCALPASHDFEAWLQCQREALHLRALALLAHISDCHERVGDPEKSLPFALRLHRLEPWNEVGVRRVMRLQARNGQRVAALATYQACCEALRIELDVLPGADTQALAQCIRRGDTLPTVHRVAPPIAALLLPVTERRQVTVLYCKLVPSGVDNPDEVLALLRAPQARCAEIVQAYTGHLVQAYGGSFLAYFGYPRAHENAVRLAVQAGLALTQLAFAGIELNVGIHTGVVISGGEAQAPDAIGATSGLAIRLRQLAGRGEVAISRATHHLVAGYFECESLGLQSLPGSSCPQEVFRVDRSSGARDRVQAAAALTPLVGRALEITALRELWQAACQGVQRIVLLRGEAGIGKSRLVLALKSAIEVQAHTVREIRCLPEYTQSPFYPLTALLSTTLAFTPEDSPPTRFGKLAANIEQQHAGLERRAATPMEKQAAGVERRAVALFAGMLGLPLREPYREPTSSTQQQREQVLGLMLDRLHALATQQPLLLVVEDLHWADPSTLEFLTLLATQARPVPLLAVFTARPEFQSSSLPRAVRTLELQALNDLDAAALVKAMAPTLAPVAVRQIVERADGIPLFAEEMARDAAVQMQSAIPSSLQDLLAARLDGLGAAKAVAQAASTIGREFDLKLLRAISPFNAATLGPLLRQLQDARLLQDGESDVFHFRHALMAEAAYQSQTRDEMQAVHRRIATAMQAHDAGVRPELLARHWAAGGEARSAIVCWIDAGKAALQHSASHEAVAHFESGLALIAGLSNDPQRVRLELDLQIGLGAAACAAQGYASATGAAAYARAMALCGEHESSPDMFCSVWGLWAGSSSRVGYGAALELAQQLQRMAEQSGDPVHTQQAHFAVANTLYWQGDFMRALAHLEQVTALYRPEHHARHVAGFGEDGGVTSSAYRAWVLWFLGYPEQARQASGQSLALARQLGHPFSLAYALTFAAILHCRLREPEMALTLAEETLSLAVEHGFPLWQIGATLARGWALAQQGDGQGAELMEECLEAMRGAMGGVTLVVLGPLVDAHLALGAYRAALAVHSEAVAVAETLGDGHITAELHRLKGEALLGLEPTGADRDEAAQACFRQALKVARQQQARTLELRAAVSLARLWQAQGQRGAAKRLLATVYKGFDEGLDTLDLHDARSLLDELSASARK